MTDPKAPFPEDARLTYALLRADVLVLAGHVSSPPDTGLLAVLMADDATARRTLADLADEDDDAPTVLGVLGNPVIRTWKGTDGVEVGPDELARRPRGLWIPGPTAPPAPSDAAAFARLALGADLPVPETATQAHDTGPDEVEATRESLPADTPSTERRPMAEIFAELVAEAEGDVRDPEIRDVGEVRPVADIAAADVATVPTADPDPSAERHDVVDTKDDAVLVPLGELGISSRFPPRPGVERRIVAGWRVSRNSVVLVTVERSRGRDYLDIRRWLGPTDALTPTSKGLYVATTEIPNILETIRKVRETPGF